METIRELNATILAPVMRLTGFRFSKDYRRGTTRFHRVVYALVSTVSANLKAGLQIDQAIARHIR